MTTATARRRPHFALLLLGSLALALPLTAAPGTVRIAQTNSAGDNVVLINPATNKIVGEITDIERPHGIKASPDGTRLYVTSMGEHTVDVVDARTLKVTRRIPTSGMPHNIAIGRDGRRLYVAIQDNPGGVDVIDTTTLQVIRTVRMRGATHNPFVTPDGKYVVAGISGAPIADPMVRGLTVIDTATLEPLWSLYYKGGVRPMTFDTNPDGSTKRIFAQISNLNGFLIVDFEQHKEVGRVEFPSDVPPEKQESAATGVMEGANTPAHGISVSPDGKTLWACSLRNSRVYAYALPDLKFLGAVPVGRAPYWLTFTPDSKTVYVANAMSGTVSVIDVASRKELTRIPVGQAVPERVETVLIDTAARAAAER